VPGDGRKGEGKEGAHSAEKRHKQNECSIVTVNDSIDPRMDPSS